MAATFDMTLKSFTVAYWVAQALWWVSLVAFVLSKGATWVWLVLSSVVCIAAWFIRDSARKRL
jgi:hypothetical protein